MPDLLTLEALDADGAIQEAAHALDPEGAATRSAFFRKAAIGGGALVAGGVVFGGLPTPALGAPSKEQDVEILNYALTLEYLEAAFYKEALSDAGLRGETRRFAQVAGAHESAHVTALRGVLGRAAVRSPRFAFGNTTQDADVFARTALAVEDLGVSAYAGQGPRLTQTAVVRAALSIHSVEARHAAWIRNILGVNPAPRAFDPARNMAQVLKVAGGFIRS